MEKGTNPNTGGTPPQVLRGALYQGPSTDSKVFLYGGTTSGLNRSSPYFVDPQSPQYTLWSYDTSSGDWDQYDVSMAGGNRPSWGAWTEAPDQGMAFFLNGLYDNGSSLNTQNLAENVQFVESMQVLDLKTHTAKNVSTSVLSRPGYARIGGSMEYVPSIGKKGILALMGGGEQDYQNCTGPPPGTLVNGSFVSPVRQDGSAGADWVRQVSMDTVNVFDIASLDQGGNGSWYAQQTSGDTPSPRADFCLVGAAAPDNSSYNM